VLVACASKQRRVKSAGRGPTIAPFFALPRVEPFKRLCRVAHILCALAELAWPNPEARHPGRRFVASECGSRVGDRDMKAFPLPGDL